MARSQWHRFYVSSINAPPELLFKLLSDLPNYPSWLPGSSQYGGTTDVEPIRSGAAAGIATANRTILARTGGGR